MALNPHNGIRSQKFAVGISSTEITLFVFKIVNHVKRRKRVSRLSVPIAESRREFDLEKCPTVGKRVS